MTENPFSAPIDNAIREPAPRRDPLAAYSDKELKKLLQHYRDRFAWCAYFGLGAFACFIFTTLPDLDPILKSVFVLIALWLTATIILMQIGHQAGRLMALFSFGFMILSGIIQTVTSGIGGLIGIALAVVGFKHAYDTSALYDGTAPTRKALKKEKKRRKQLART